MAGVTQRSRVAGSWGRRPALAAMAGLAMAATLAAAPGSVAAQEAITAARFSITIDGYEIASFSEAQLGSSIVADGSGTTRKLRTQGTATLKRPQGSNLALWSWHETVLQQRAGPRPLVVLHAYNVEGKPVARYHLENAWPQTVEVSQLKAGASEVLMESVTIVADSLRRIE